MVRPVCSSYRWAQTRIIPPPLLLEKVASKFEYELRSAVKRDDSEQAPASVSDPVVCREIVSLCGCYLHLAVVPDSLLDALEEWLQR